MAVHLYPNALLTPDHTDVSDGLANRLLATVFYSDVDTYVTAFEWRAPDTGPISFASISYWDFTGDDPTANSGSRIDLQTFGAITLGAWNSISATQAWFLPANKPRLVQVHTADRYTYSDPGDFAFASDDGHLHAYSAAAGGNGRWQNSGDQNSMAPFQGQGYNFYVGAIVDYTLAHAKGADFLPFF